MSEESTELLSRCPACNQLLPARTEKALADPAKPFTFVTGGEDYNGRWFPVIWRGDPPEQKAFSDEDIVDLAAFHDVPEAHVDAVIRTEAKRAGYLLTEPRPARPKILFEGHVFYDLTPHPVSKTRPDLSYPHWTRQYYRGGSGEWERLRDAAAFDFRQALKAASWGLGQVLGKNFHIAGCETLEQFIEEEFESERKQLDHMFGYIVSASLLTALRHGDWHHFARGYNGPGYRKNNYHNVLARYAAQSRFA